MGRLKLRWADCVEDGFKVLRVTNWRTVLLNGDPNGRGFLRKPWTTQGCCVNKRRKDITMRDVLKHGAIEPGPRRHRGPRLALDSVSIRSKLE
ncbi:hypothetical protein TNCV_3969111 [Trichonephila clavipes]|nr:hypothetical protein TNCV_3969111 [Trichonephila clavipes]